jgi:hypothetical protein
MAQTIASIEADIATIIKRTLGNIPPRKGPARDPGKNTRHRGERPSRGQFSRSNYTITFQTMRRCASIRRLSRQQRAFPVPYISTLGT